MSLGLTLPLELVGYGISQALTPDGNPPLMGPAGDYNPQPFTDPYAKYAGLLNSLQPGSHGASVTHNPYAGVTDSGGVLREGPGAGATAQVTGNPYAQYANQLNSLQQPMAAPAPTAMPQPHQFTSGGNGPYGNYDFSKLQYNPTPPGLLGPAGGT